MLTGYKLISALLDYPDADTARLLDEARDIAVESGQFDRKALRRLDRFVSRIKRLTLMEWQMAYVGLFDCSSATTLYLFERVYGSSRERGMAMSDLIDTYAARGVEISSGELPDYLPVVLEFLSMYDSPQEAADFLAATDRILRDLHRRLAKEKEPYSSLVAILLQWAAKGNPGDSGEAPRGHEGCDADAGSLPACSGCMFSKSDKVEQL